MLVPRHSTLDAQHSIMIQTNNCWVKLILHVSIILLVTIIGHAFIISPSEQRTKSRVARSILFASDIVQKDNNKKPQEVVVEDDPTGGCGEGFYKSEDGDYCVFDYDTAAQAFGTADEEEMVNDADHYWEELDNQNAARKKFGLDPLSPEQYVALQGQIHQLQTEQQEKLVNLQEKVAAAAKIEADYEKEQQSSPFAPMKDFMNSFMKDTCAANYDCQRPEVCCDFGFKKMCCSSGQMTKDLKQEYAMIPVPMRSD